MAAISQHVGLYHTQIRATMWDTYGFLRETPGRDVKAYGGRQHESAESMVRRCNGSDKGSARACDESVERQYRFGGPTYAGLNCQHG